MALISFESIIWIFVFGFLAGIGFTILLMVRSKRDKLNKESKKSDTRKNQSDNNSIGGR